MWKFSYRFVKNTFRKINPNLWNLSLVVIIFHAEPFCESLQWFSRMPFKWTKTDFDSDRILGLPLVARNWRARKAFVLVITREVKVKLPIILRTWTHLIASGETVWRPLLLATWAARVAMRMSVSKSLLLTALVFLFSLDIFCKLKRKIIGLSHCFWEKRKQEIGRGWGRECC